MVRIRYTNTLGDEQGIVTKQTYILPTGQVVYGHINNNVFPIQVKVRELDRENTFYETTVGTLKEAKSMLKSALEVLGVVFGTELRAKKNQKELDSVEQQLTDDLKDTL